MTLLVNVWLNHVPWAADPLHDEAAAQMSAPPPAVDLSRPHAPSRRAFAHRAALAPTAVAPTASAPTASAPTAGHGYGCGSARFTSAVNTPAAGPAAAAAAAEATVAGRWEVTHVGGDPMSLVLPTATAATPYWGDGTDSGDGFVALSFRGDGTAALERAPSPPPPPAASKTKRKR